MRHVFIINPAAGKHRDILRLQSEARALCAQRGVECAVSVTECAGDAVRLTRGYAQDGVPSRIYACGGDGTLNEVVQAAAGAPHLAVTNVPLGTGNDFLKLFGPTYRERFSDLGALLEGPQASFDLIDCNGRLGLDIICAGVDARVAKDVDAYKAIPLVTGKGAYILSLIANVLFKGISREMEVEMDGRRWNEPITLVCVCNGRYYGGGFMPVGDAMPDDGVLDVLLVPKVGRVTFARLVGDYAKGDYRKHPELIHEYHGPGPVVLRARTPITAVADGEVLEDRSLTIRLADQKLNFFYPADLTWKSAPRQEKEMAGAVGK